MKIVRKYIMPEPSCSSEITMPAQWRPLHVQMQGDLIMMWVEVAADAVYDTKVAFSTVGTGQAVPAHWTHMGTTLDGNFVWHVYMSTTRCRG